MIYNKIQEIVIEGLVNKLDSIITEGLKLKGFEFKNRLDFENFIKTRCKREDYIQEKKHIYYVDNKPFLLHYYEPIQEPINFSEPFKIKVNYNYGKYSFL